METTTCRTINPEGTFTVGLPCFSDSLSVLSTTQAEELRTLWLNYIHELSSLQQRSMMNSTASATTSSVDTLLQQVLLAATASTTPALTPRQLSPLASSRAHSPLISNSPSPLTMIHHANTTTTAAASRLATASAPTHSSKSNNNQQPKDSVSAAPTTAPHSRGQSPTQPPNEPLGSCSNRSSSVPAALLSASACAAHGSLFARWFLLPARHDINELFTVCARLRVPSLCLFTTLQLLHNVAATQPKELAGPRLRAVTVAGCLLAAWKFTDRDYASPKTIANDPCWSRHGLDEHDVMAAELKVLEASDYHVRTPWLWQIIETLCSSDLVLTYIGAGSAVAGYVITGLTPFHSSSSSSSSSGHQHHNSGSYPQQQQQQQQLTQRALGRHQLTSQQQSSSAAIGPAVAFDTLSTSDATISTTKDTQQQQPQVTHNKSARNWCSGRWSECGSTASRASSFHSVLAALQRCAPNFTLQKHRKRNEKRSWPDASLGPRVERSCEQPHHCSSNTKQAQNSLPGNNGASLFLLPSNRLVLAQQERDHKLLKAREQAAAARQMQEVSQFELPHSPDNRYHLQGSGGCEDLGALRAKLGVVSRLRIQSLLQRCRLMLQRLIKAGAADYASTNAAATTPAGGGNFHLLSSIDILSSPLLPLAIVVAAGGCGPSDLVDILSNSQAKMALKENELGTKPVSVAEVFAKLLPPSPLHFNENELNDLANGVTRVTRMARTPPNANDNSGNCGSPQQRLKPQHSTTRSQLSLLPTRSSQQQNHQHTSSQHTASSSQAALIPKNDVVLLAPSSRPNNNNNFSSSSGPILESTTSSTNNGNPSNRSDQNPMLWWTRPNQ